MIIDEVNKLWVERYRPKTIEDCVLPADLKKTFGEFVNKNYIPNLLLTGRAGVGKTTVARAMLEECGFDYIVINGSMNGNIDTLRTQIRDFASTMSFSSSRKYVILDEADYLNPQSTQPALRNFMEEYSNNCGFVMTCNFKNRIIEPLHSRCSVVDFNIPTSDKPKLATQFLKRTKKILDENEVEYKDNVIGELIMKHFPDWRRVLNELQRYSATGSMIDVGILANMSDDNFKEVISLLKAKNFKEMRKWVGKNSDVESSVMFRRLYDNACGNMNASTIPRLVLILADYGYKSAFVVDQEINLVACLTEIMMECEFK
jgi:DNA polymerase III delta prime subunit